MAHVDRFGNLITNIPAEWIPPRASIWVGAESIGGVRTTYSDVGAGERLALIGSLGLLEISVREGSARERLGVERGSPVIVRP